MTATPRWLRTIVLLAAPALLACDGGPLGPEDGAVLFITQSQRPNAVMQALFEGRVVVDAAGCLRLDGPDPATVVWPVGFHLATAGARLIVLDDASRTVGRIGETFRLGGGEVETLHAGIALAAPVRDRALARCPGRFWVVGEVVR